MIAEIELHPAQVVQDLRLAAFVPDGLVERKRLTELVHRFGVSPELPGGKPGVAERIGHAVEIPGSAVKDSRFLRVGQGLTGASRPVMGCAHLVQRLRLAPLVGQRPVERCRLLS